MTQGIYAITHVPSGRVYIGAARNYEQRFKQHLDRLAKGKHHNGMLQSAYAKDGETGFTVALLEVVEDKDDLRAREGYWIEQHKGNTLNSSKASGYSPTRGSWMNPQIRQGIKEWLSENGVSQAYLADELGIARPNINRMFNDKSPRSVVWQRMFDILGLDVVFRDGQLIVLNTKTNEIERVLLELTVKPKAPERES